MLKAMLVLPVPKEARGLPGVCSVGSDDPVEVHAEDPRVERAILRWRSSLSGSGGRPGTGTVRVAVDSTQVPHPQGYRFTVHPHGIEVLGGSDAGCFYAVQTLAQLSRLGKGRIPCCEVADWPDFHTRGLLYDVGRGKVPTLATLKLLADRLAVLKGNQLQLYIEHAFVFSFDPGICDSDHGLTPDEVRELDEYCRERFIDLVPAMATFGHMGRILSMPKYRHLAEIEASNVWSKMSWPERVRGLTLDCMNPEARKLVENMWSDVLDAFSSPIVNICGDEPWDLGEGKNRDLLADGGKGEAYIDQIRRTHECCAARGRRTQFWSDVVCNYPRLFDRVPRDSTVLHWGYDDGADYEGTARFVEAGLDTFVCPGTLGWKRIINAMNPAERNIAIFAATGRKHGVTGLLNTDWGDHGHFNLLACSWHGLAEGAAFGWNAAHPTGGDFDELFARLVLGVDDRAMVSALREASAWAERCETWRLLWIPLRQMHDDPMLPTIEQAERAGQLARSARRRCQRVASETERCSHDVEELAVACRFSELLAGKIVIANRLDTTSRNSKTVRADRHAWADRLVEAARAYDGCWRSRNKPSGLADVLGALAAAGDEIRELEF